MMTLPPMSIGHCTGADTRSRPRWPQDPCSEEVRMHTQHTRRCLVATPHNSNNRGLTSIHPTNRTHSIHRPRPRGRPPGRQRVLPGPAPAATAAAERRVGGGRERGRRRRVWVRGWGWGRGRRRGAAGGRGPGAREDGVRGVPGRGRGAARAALLLHGLPPGMV